VAPAVVILIAGMLVLGWAFHCQSSVRLALGQGARVVQLNNSLSESDLQTLVRATLAKIADDNVDVSLAVSTPYTGVKVATLTATYNFAISVPLLPTRLIQFSDTETVVLKVS
jgi:Flp pilus assembly protein TadG